MFRCPHLFGQDHTSRANLSTSLYCSYYHLLFLLLFILIYWYWLLYNIYYYSPYDNSDDYSNRDYYHREYSNWDWLLYITIVTYFHHPIPISPGAQRLREALWELRDDGQDGWHPAFRAGGGHSFRAWTGLRADAGGMEKVDLIRFNWIEWDLTGLNGI